MVGNTIRCDTCSVVDRSICSALTRPEAERLTALAHNKFAPPGHVIVRDTEAASYFATIVTGVVKLTKSLSDGRQQIVGLLFPGDFIGRPFRTNSFYSAEAVTSVQMCTFERVRFENFVQEVPTIEHRLFRHALDELDEAQEWMLLLGRKNAAEKLASFLLMLARRVRVTGYQEGSHAVHFDLPLTRAEIADFLGLTIETVSRQFTQLKNLGHIEIKGARTIIVKDMRLLLSNSASFTRSSGGSVSDSRPIDNENGSR